MNKTFKEIEKHIERAAALQAATILFEWDSETLEPPAAGELTAGLIGSLSAQYQELMTDPGLQALVEQCEKEKGLTETEEGILKELKRQIKELKSIPPKEYRAYKELIAGAVRIWERARAENDFSLFAPTLQEIVDYKKRFASYRAEKGQKLYDVMLDEFEKDFHMAQLDPFFETLKQELVPIIKKLVKENRKPDTSFLTAGYSLESQEQAAKFIAEYVGMDFNKGVLGVSAHPFTTNLHNKDVRITTHYTDSIDTSVFSVIHETGHAIYELGVRDDLTLTPLGSGASMGMHESQSRFYENVIGRCEAFWEPVYERVAAIFGPPLTDISLDSFIKAVNRVEPGLIRTNADELTYALHVQIRYELEKMMIEEDVPVTELPEIWNRKYEEYLGVRPERDGEGILQDIHWSQGLFGYFPSYALGSAFAAQIYLHMKKTMDVEQLLREGKLSVIQEYLRENIHQFGRLKTARQIIKDVTGEDFKPEYYVEYLREKYEK